jgi:hypothetical protein
LTRISSSVLPFNKEGGGLGAGGAADVEGAGSADDVAAPGAGGEVSGVLDDAAAIRFHIEI